VTQLFVVDTKAYSELAGREDFVNKSQSKMNMTNGNVFYFDLPEHKEKERERETWNKRLFKSIFAATERGVKLDIIGNGIDGGYGEASNMFKRMYLKNRYRINPIPRGTALILADLMDKIAAKKNQPYLEFLAQVKNIRAWTHFQYMHSKKFQFDRIVSVVSSYNLEEWSGDKSHESAVVCLDKNLNQQLERSFLLDVVNSQPAYAKNLIQLADEIP
jgi:phosphatidylserine/phosphatidylglycerophosphate/cardiolipin synthase-like enzyme